MAEKQVVWQCRLCGLKAQDGNLTVCPIPASVSRTVRLASLKAPTVGFEL